MRFYSFVNMYFTGIHAGIQSAHAVHALETKYRKLDEDSKALSPSWDPYTESYGKYLDWSEDHKTMILKKVVGSDAHQALQDLYNTLEPLAATLRIPIVLWNEPSANNCNTAVGLVVPAYIYNMPEYRFSEGEMIFAQTIEQKIKKIIDSHRMAT